MVAHSFTRITSFLIDSIILSLLLSLLTFWVPQSNSYQKALEDERNLLNDYSENKIDFDTYFDKYIENQYLLEKESILITLVSSVLSIGYFGTFAYYNNGQTLGKKLLKIKVTSNSGKELKHTTYILRALILSGVLFSLISCVMLLFIKSNQYLYTVFPVSMVSSFITIVSALMIAFRKDKRAIHDLICDTKVIEE